MTSMNLQMKLMIEQIKISIIEKYMINNSCQKSFQFQQYDDIKNSLNISGSTKFSEANQTAQNDLEIHNFDSFVIYFRKVYVPVVRTFLFFF